MIVRSELVKLVLSSCRTNVHSDKCGITNLNVKYSCDQCDYESGQQFEVNEQISLMHKLFSCDVYNYSCLDFSKCTYIQFA